MWGMTIDDVKALYDDELRVKVAELCGWVRSENPFKNSRETWYRPETLLKIPQVLDDLPDYCGSLDAMHHAEQTLSADQWNEYVRELDFIVRKTAEHLPAWKEINPSRVIDAVLVHATARHKAEAFILATESR